MKQRIFSFAFLWTVLGLSLWIFGVHAGILLVALVSFLTQLELYRLFERMDLYPMKALGLVCGVFITIGSYYFGGLDAGNDIFLISFLVLTLTIIRIDLQAGRLRSFMPTLFGLIYVPYLLHFLIKIIKMAEATEGYDTGTGLFLSLWIIAVSKCADVGGLLVGTSMGRTPLSVISPKKTYEGAIGGVAASMLAGVVFLWLFHEHAPEGFHSWLAVLIAIPVAIASIASDLVESAFKRQAGVKDSGRLIPGVGGAFDLADSLILTAPLGYLIFKNTVL